MAKKNNNSQQNAANGGDIAVLAKLAEDIRLSIRMALGPRHARPQVDLCLQYPEGALGIELRLGRWRRGLRWARGRAAATRRPSRNQEQQAQEW